MRVILFLLVFVAAVHTAPTKENIVEKFKRIIHISTLLNWKPKAKELKYGYFDPDTKTFTSLDEADTDLSETLGQLFFRSLEKHQDKVVIIEFNTGKEFTGKQILETSSKIAHGLLDLGLKRQDVLFSVAPNTFLHTCLFVAVQLIGRIYSGAAYNHPQEKIQGRAERVEAKGISCWSENRAIVEEVADGISSIEFVVLIDDKTVEESKTKGGKRIIPISTLKNWKPKTNDPQLPIIVDTEATACVLHSSGTTGTPKGIIRSQRNLVFNLKNKQKLISSIIFTPFAHASGLMAVSTAIVMGNPIVLLQEWNLNHVLETIQKYKLRQCPMSPADMILMANSPLRRKYDLSSLKLVVTGGAPVAYNTITFFKTETGIPSVHELYASTENGIPTIPVETEGFISAGRVAPGVSIRIWKDDKFLGPGESGEICVKSPDRTPGYFKNRDKKLEDDIIDGFLRSGDIGYFDKDGLLFIDGRIKEMIKVGNNQVNPNDLETILVKHEEVEEAAVARVQDSKWIEIPRAFVVLKQKNLNEASLKVLRSAIREFVDSQVAEYEKLRGGIVFVPELPKNNGKIVKSKLLELYPRGEDEEKDEVRAK